ncbi:MAG: Crp/Fnr family transcriptional regulator [Gammaproteobacteria bacterium]|nr:MAG: Crp/Fnr family transcriptional regulator [Gammaproteobacteria bacterium]
MTISSNSSTVSQFQHIRDTAGKEVLARSQTMQFPANTTVFRQGDLCQNYIMVIKGSVKVFSRAENGREILLYRVQTGESCTLTTACLFGNNKYPAEGITETEVNALVIPHEAFNQGLANSEDFRRIVFDGYSKQLSNIITLVEEVSFGRVDVRLAKALQHHIVGDMTLHITHQALANELGSVREVISRQLKEFENRGWVKLHRGSIEILNSSELEKLARTPLL